jgi:hypothetical protein
MAFPNDLSDILPLLPGTSETRRLPIFGHVIFVEVAKQPEGYRLIVSDLHKGKMRKRFGSDGLYSEEEVELIWQEFLEERRSIFADTKLR